MKPLALEVFGVSTEFRKEPVHIDFRGLDPGVYAFTGPNGSGKSHLLECMCPGALFRTLPSYGESIAAHIPADIRNAYVQLDFELEPGSIHRALVKVDGQSRKTEAYWYTWEPEWAKFVPKAGPLLQDFDRYAAAMIPSLREVLAGPFAAQQAASSGGDFFSLKPADRKRLFIEWLGIEQDVEIAKRASEGSAVAQDELDDLRIKLRSCESTVAVQASLEARRQVATDSLTLTRASLEAAGPRAEAAATAYEEARAALAAEESTAKAARASYERVLRDIERAEKDMKILGPARPVDPVSDEDIETAATFTSHLSAMHDAAKGKLTAARREAKAAAELKQTAVEAFSAKKQAGAVAARARERMVGVDLEHPMCSACPLTAGAREDVASDDPNEFAAAAAALEAATAAATAAADVERAAAKAEADTSDAFAAAFDEERRLEKQQAAAKAEGLAEQQRAAIRQTLKDLDAELDAIVIPNLKDREVEVARRSDQKLETAGNLRALRDDEKALEKEIAGIEAAIAAGGEVDDMGEIRARIAVLEDQVAGGELLAFTYGPLGVPGIKIERAGPGISTTANRLLEHCYGPRFKLRLVTTQPKKDGSGFKDSFECEILDSETGGAPHRGSPGQMVIMSEALRGAICIEVVRASGKACRTLWRDEVAGALDQDEADNAAMRYLDMLRAIREEGGFDYVFFIAHQPALWQSADGVFRVAKGTVTFDG